MEKKNVFVSMGFAYHGVPKQNFWKRLWTYFVHAMLNREL